MPERLPGAGAAVYSNSSSKEQPFGPGPERLPFGAEFDMMGQRKKRGETQYEHIRHKQRVLL